MPRSIEEIQRDLEQSEANLTAISCQSDKIERELQILNAQEQQIVNKALAPTQIENRKLLTEIQGSISTMERNIGQSAADLKNAYENLAEIDVDSINQSTRDMNSLLKLANPERRDELITALDEVYKEHKETLKKAYQEQKNQYDSLISDKKVELAELEKKYRNLKIKRIVRYTLIAAIILFMLAFAIRWGTLLRNQISPNEPKSEQVGQISTETEKTDTDKNRGFLEWLLPADGESH